MAKRYTYCEVNFLKKFSDCYAQSSPFDGEQVLKNKCWLGLFSFLVNKSILVLDSKGQFNVLSQENKLCAKLKKMWTGGYIKIDEKKVDLSTLPEDALCTSVFLLDDQPFVIQKAEKLGILLITPSTYAQFAFLYKDNGMSFHKNEEADWSMLKREAKHNYNTIVISDHYLLKDKKINLYAILAELLPSNLDTTMHISIFTDDTPTFQKDHQDLVEYIKTIRPRLKFELSLHKGFSSDFHDRGIVTNYARMICGAGFDLFKIDERTKKQVAKHTTSVLIDYPYFKDSKVTEDNYEDILIDTKRMYHRNYAIGTKNNRLLADF